LLCVETLVSIRPRCEGRIFIDVGDLMAHYAISFEVRDSRHSPHIRAKLEGMGAARLLESLWVLTSPKSAPQIRDELQKMIDLDDAVAVIELKAGSYWSCLRAKHAGVMWLKRCIAY
jgi:hypothetical protein